MFAQLLTLLSRTPLHAGCGLRVDVVDLPFNRERVTQFPVIPSANLRIPLQAAARQSSGQHAAAQLFGGEPGEATPGCVQILEAKILAFPVRALKGCFAWLTCPAILHRFARDTRKLAPSDIPSVAPDRALVAGKSDLLRDDRIYLEEFRLQASLEPAAAHRAIATALRSLSDDSLWQSKLTFRLAIVSDEDFQHFVTTCTEVVAAAEAGPGAGLSQEFLPSETLFYSVLTVLPKEGADEAQLRDGLTALLNASPLLPVGDGMAAANGLCALKHEVLS